MLANKEILQKIQEEFDKYDASAEMKWDALDPSEQRFDKGVAYGLAWVHKLLKEQWETEVPYCVINGENYRAELTNEGEHFIAIKNKKFGTLVQKKPVHIAAQQEARILLNQWEKRKPISNEYLRESAREDN